jgi:hypothetical protein
MHKAASWAARGALLPAQLSPERILPIALSAMLFALLFREPATTLIRDWWSDANAGHGLLLAPIGLYLAWKRRVHPQARPQMVLGSLLLVLAILLRYGAGLAAELFTMRLSMLAAAVALVVYVWGVRQVLHWWLPVSLLVLSIPLPEVLVGTLALPLQFKASQMGAATCSCSPIELCS